MRRFPHVLKSLFALVAAGLVAQMAWASAPGSRYQYGSCSGTGSVYDQKTKLMWQSRPSDNPSGDWRNSVGFCKTLQADGFTWRTPTVKELSTLVDYTAFVDGGQSKAVDSNYFRVVTPVVWTGTPDAAGTLTIPASGGEPVPSAYSVDFSSGQVTLQTMDQKLGIWCVSDASPSECR